MQDGAISGEVARTGQSAWIYPAFVMITAGGRLVRDGVRNENSTLRYL